MLNYHSVFTETIFTTLLFLCNYVKVAQLVKDKKGETCIHKLRRRRQWTKISKDNNLENQHEELCVCGSHTCSILCSAPGINVTEFLSRMCLFTVFLCHLVALFFLTMCSCKTESYLPLKTIISPDKCQQRILPHMHRDLLLLFLAVSMLLAI